MDSWISAVTGSRGRARRTRTGFPVHERATCATFPIRTMARVFKVSASGYYAWRSRPASARAAADLDLMRKIRTAYGSSRKTYGAPRIHAEFKAEGVAIGRKRVARLMTPAGAGAARQHGVTRSIAPLMTLRAATSSRRGRTSCGSWTSPSFPRSQGSCSWRLCSMHGRAGKTG